MVQSASRSGLLGVSRRVLSRELVFSCRWSDRVGRSEEEEDVDEYILEYCDVQAFSKKLKRICHGDDVKAYLNTIFLLIEGGLAMYLTLTYIYN